MGMHWTFATVGDLLSIDMGAYIHRGVYAGNNLVFTCSPTRGEHLCTLDEFVAGRSLIVTPVLDKFRKISLPNIYSILQAPKAYDVLANNCEHAVCKAYGLTPSSGQVKFWAGVAIVSALALVVARAGR